MGLCKCPKKKVTNLFCFEHTVNVCEHCLVANHSKCVVQSYLQWLQDSDYDPSCRLCGKNLSDESGGPCVRLLCYDLFHWSCLDAYARSLPPTTAPAGYTCPICHVGLFPAPNVVSPVVDTLREHLSTVNWARAGLGLPMISEPDVARPQAPNGLPPAHADSYYGARGGAGYAAQGGGGAYPQSVVAMEETAAYSRSGDKVDLYNNNYVDNLIHCAGEKASGLQSILSTGEASLNVSHDHDQDKYKRRPAFQWLSRWFSSRGSGSKRVGGREAVARRYVVLAVLAALALLTLIVVFAKFGRSDTDDDPFLDPIGNPNIRVGDS